GPSATSPDTSPHVHPSVWLAAGRQKPGTGVVVPGSVVPALLHGPAGGLRLAVHGARGEPPQQQQEERSPSDPPRGRTHGNPAGPGSRLTGRSAPRAPPYPRTAATQSSGSSCPG